MYSILSSKCKRSLLRFKYPESPLPMDQCSESIPWHFAIASGSELVKIWMRTRSLASYDGASWNLSADLNMDQADPFVKMHIFNQVTGAVRSMVTEESDQKNHMRRIRPKNPISWLIDKLSAHDYWSFNCHRPYPDYCLFWHVTIWFFFEHQAEILHRSDNCRKGSGKASHFVGWFWSPSKFDLIFVSRLIIELKKQSPVLLS